MRVLLISDLAHTGFGRVGRELARGLIAKGHDLRIIGINYRGLEGELGAIASKLPGSPREKLRSAAEVLQEDELIDITVPAGLRGDGMGHNLTAPALAGGLWTMWEPEAMLLVADPRAAHLRLEHDNGSIAKFIGSGKPALNYVPIEGRGLPKSVRTIYNFLTPVAMSSFGQAQLEETLERPVALALHGVSDEFRPITPADPAILNGQPVGTPDDAKRVLGFAGKTVILRADRYILRKNYPAYFRTLQPLMEQHPDLLAVAHTVPVDDIGWGDIRELVSKLPGARMSRLGWGHPQVHLTLGHDSFRGLSDEGLRVLYSAADIYYSPTMAEGFGLCLAESLACGTPVVATDYSSITEVVGPGGILVPPAAMFTSPYAVDWGIIDEPQAIAALDRLISRPALRRRLAAAGRKHVAQFTWASAVDVFDDLLVGTADKVA